MKSRIAASIAALAFVSGVVATASPASAATTTVGTCSGVKGLGTLKSTFIDPNTGKPAGLTSDDHDLSIGLKGVSTPANTTNFGSCGFVGGSAIPGGNGSFAISKWSGKLTSPSTDCVSGDTAANDEWTLSGALAFTFTDASKLSASFAIAGFRSGDLNQTDSTGVVTKGHAAGAFVSNQTWFDPIVKDKTQTTDTPYPGYAYQNVLSIAACAGASDTPVTVGGGASITGIAIGSGADPEGLSPDSAAGLRFYTGE